MTQKELKQVYREELKKAWSSPDMVEFCTKQAAFIIEHNDHLYRIDKPRIVTSFCFGHGYCGITTQEDEDRAGDMAHHARTSQEYFIAENLSGLNEALDDLHKIREEMGYNWAEGSAPRLMVAIGPHYYSQSADCRLNSFSVVRSWDYHDASRPLCWDVDFIDKLIAGYEQVTADFTKRLNTYLKRYGLSKVRSWSFLSD